ncbi:membrane-bound lysozyme inhibitor of c-type lysozyme MliC [Pasteurella langaaensis DSM 22999]|uniref:Membrane-bound lysozyme inhibitor of c-type lysozyme MliC n=1 Tax=Alitibacter langaaensis DSM 22999 TaxID=1122935 RepID=A0A2U0TH44_9PAST|nr:MliC family protein [Pasteurella langaaensis]PVX42848.1 membrane-bound lysozyme inhibitor of c-type lysozyme MliC [Pasteurella langaaensis DSM 22999]
MKTTALLLLSAFTLTACNTKMVAQAPIDAMASSKPKTTNLDKTVQIGFAARFQCKDDKIVRIVRNTPKNNSKVVKAVETISLTFNNVTEKLKSTVSQTGKAYTSIHWHWVERNNGTATLTNAVGDILADVCIEQATSQ